MTEVIAALPVHWRFFMKSRLFEMVPAIAEETTACPLREAVSRLRQRYPEMFPAG